MHHPQGKCPDQEEDFVQKQQHQHDRCCLNNNYKKIMTQKQTGNNNIITHNTHNTVNTQLTDHFLDEANAKAHPSIE